MAATKKPKRSTDPSEEPKVDLTPHPLVARLNPHGDPPPDLIVLDGFIGPSKKPDWMRLYLNSSFDTLVDIPVSGIVSTQPVDASDENSPTRVWIRAETRLDVVQSMSRTVEATYLRGGIVRQYLPRTAAAGTVANVNDREANTNVCDSFFVCGGDGGNDPGGGGSISGPGCEYTFAGSLCLTCRPPVSHMPYRCP